METEVGESQEEAGLVGMGLVGASLVGKGVGCLGVGCLEVGCLEVVGVGLVGAGFLEAVKEGEGAALGVVAGNGLHLQMAGAEVMVVVTVVEAV